jgi:hypothetical protein
MLKRACAFVLLLTAVACGSGSSATTSPSLTPTAFTLSGQVTDSTTAAPISGATVSISDGPHAGTSMTSGGSGRYSFAGLQQSRFTVSVSASTYVSQSKGVTLTSDKTLSFQLHTAPATSLSNFMRNYIQAIFLGAGPLSPTDGNYACPTVAGVWTAFPRGTSVSVRVSSTESLDKRQAIQNAAAQVGSATMGAILTVFTVTDDPNPIPNPNEATSTTHPTPSSQGCQSDNGCTIHGFVSAGVLRSSRAVQPASQTSNAYAHDVIGHGVMGMCHVDGSFIGGAGLSIMSGGRNVFSGQIALELTAFDMAAAQAVYGSGLNPGATWADFRRLGLINSSSNQTTTLFQLFTRTGKRD